MNSTPAVRARLIAEAPILSALDTYKGQPAIFSRKAPEAFQFGAKAVIVLPVPTRDDQANTLTSFGRDVVREIRVYAKETSSDLDLDNLAVAIRDIFDARPDELFIDGGRCSLSTATGPVEAPTSDASIVGRRVTLRLLLERN